MIAPRDFLDEDYSPASVKAQPRDFLMSDQDETLGEAAKLAPFRIGEDVYDAAYQGAQKIPDYWEKSRTEVPGFFNPMNFLRHPMERGKQSLAGLLELAQGINHAPRNIAQYASSRLHLIPQKWADKVPAAPSLDQDIENYLGQPKNPGDALSRGIARNANLILPGAMATKTLNPLNLTAKNIAKDVIKTREKNINNYGKQYENLWNEAEGKGFSNALYDIDIDMPTISKYSSNKNIKGVLDFDANPTLENAHTAKSDLLRIKRDLDRKTTLSTAERQQMKAVNNAIDSINSNMFKESNGSINKLLADKYQGTQQGYKNEVVPYKNRAIGEYLRGESSPDELVNSLSKKAFYAKRGKYHKALKIRKNIKNHPYLSSLGIGGALGGLGVSLYQELFGKSPKQ